MERDRERGEHYAGVSPVVSVILMVGITMILAGVVFFWTNHFIHGEQDELEFNLYEVRAIDDPDGDHIDITIMKGQIDWSNTKIVVVSGGKTEIYGDVSLAGVSSAGDTNTIQNFIDGSGNAAIFDQNIGDTITVKIVDIQANIMRYSVDIKMVYI